jgi:hypothetical protein
MEGGGCGVSAHEYSCAHGAQIIFGDLVPYLTYGYDIPSTEIETPTVTTVTVLVQNVTLSYRVNFLSEKYRKFGSGYAATIG